MLSQENVRLPGDKRNNTNIMRTSFNIRYKTELKGVDVEDSLYTVIQTYINNMKQPK